MEQIFSLWAESFDLPVLEWIASNLHCAFLDTVMPLITVLGNAGIVWIVAAVLLMIFPKYRKLGVCMGMALMLGVLVGNVLMKPGLARIRPFDYQLEHFGKTIELLISAPKDYSFPSGHTLASFEAATVLMINNRKMGIPALILACLIAFSRLYLYVHYPTDVICGIVLGVLFGVLGNMLVNKVLAKEAKETKEEA